MRPRSSRSTCRSAGSCWRSRADGAAGRRPSGSVRGAGRAHAGATRGRCRRRSAALRSGAHPGGARPRSRPARAPRGRCRRASGRRPQPSEDAGYAVDEIEPPAIDAAAKTAMDMLIPDLRAAWPMLAPVLPGGDGAVPVGLDRAGRRPGPGDGRAGVRRAAGAAAGVGRVPGDVPADRRPRSPPTFPSRWAETRPQPSWPGSCAPCG